MSDALGHKDAKARERLHVKTTGATGELGGRCLGGKNLKRKTRRGTESHKRRSVGGQVPAVKNSGDSLGSCKSLS